MKYFSLFIATLSLLITACTSKPDTPSDKQITEMVTKSLFNLERRLDRKPFFEITDINILSRQGDAENASATLDITLSFPEDFQTVVEQRHLKPFNLRYLQYQSSFGKFSAGDIQVHHAEYQFSRDGETWHITGTKKLAPATPGKPDAE
jgi:hypothetical protein